MSSNQPSDILDGLQDRDAVHVAVLSAIAGEALEPGQKITPRSPGSRIFVACHGPYPLAVVWPFLGKTLNPGEPFWAMMVPGTVTGMRHHWSHPEYPDEMAPAKTPKKSGIQAAEAMAVLDEIGDMYGRTGQDLLDDLEEAAINGWVGVGDDEGYKDVPYDRWKEAWAAYTVLTGKEQPEDNEDGCPYSCSC